ncbi:hypothetical protein ALP8811_03105 [Aliiroseovarius pelagivivens]|uniref:Uncharacterized protein n=2 Tax=Aliiroseovarius pelagivivens TaxID=1639690 RepID=A0A2R8ATF4_9RHOB|nr:hypothetical protein ALP8811_03105 [Aliiroseovarius pelagivivens]
MFCDLFVSTNKQHILPAPLKDLLGVLDTYRLTNSTAMDREGGRVSYFISDIVFDDSKDLAFLYVGKHDENGSDPAISTKQSAGSYDTDIIEKKVNQGNAAGGHIAIHLVPRNTKDGHLYYTAVEASEGLGRSICQALLRYVFNEIYVNDPQEMTAKRTTSTAKKAEPYRPLFEFLGMPKDFIEADLAKAHGVDLKIVRTKPTGTMGHAAASLQAEEAVVLKPSKEQGFPKTIDGIKNIIKAVPGKLLSGRFSYKLNGTTQPIKFKIVDGTVLFDELLIQKMIVGPISSKMATITPDSKIHSEFSELMAKVLVDKINSLK